MGKTHKDRVIGAVFHDRTESLTGGDKAKFNQLFHKSTRGGYKHSMSGEVSMHEAHDLNAGLRFGNQRKAVAKEKVFARKSERAKLKKLIQIEK